MFGRKRIGLRGLICTAALLGLLAAASPALASDAYLVPWVVKYDAAPGEANQTTVSGAVGPFADNSPRLIAIDDPGASITAHWGIAHGGGCEELKSSRVSCTLEDSFVEVSLGDLDDRFSMEAVAADVRARVWGDQGDDVLRGGRASDLLFGGAGTDTLDGRAGADLMIGGEGPDFADYSARTVPVTVTIPEPSPPFTGPITFETSSPIDFGPGPRPEWPVGAGNDGQSGEGDDIQADVEDVSSGSSGDALSGSSADNWLNGHAGDDSLYGGAGYDELYGEQGHDVLRGSGDGDRLDGGPGRDDLNAGGGDDQIYARDGERDRIDCGSGSDTVFADPNDSFRDCSPEDIQP